MNSNHPHQQPLTHTIRLILFGAGTMVSATLSPFALAQSPEGATQRQATSEEVIVTGSRIVRRDFQSNSPIVTVDAGDFETQAGLNIESYLNQLPSYNPASAPTTTQGDVQITPVNSVGIASISLRGFGPNRSLVLVNGKRTTPINALMVTDINGIPSALIQRVETISGGASAVYGADAVAGVTNFILRDNFEGFEIDAQYGQSEQGDGEESRVSMILGANLADGRGNVTLGMERYDRKAVLQRNHSHYTNDIWNNPYAPGGSRLMGINGFTCNAFWGAEHGGCPNVSTINALFADRPDGTNVVNPNSIQANGNLFSGSFNFNRDGSIWANNGGGFYRYNGPINSEYAPNATLDANRPPASIEIRNLQWNNTQAMVSAPQERYSYFASGNFDITDKINVYARGMMAESKTRTQLFGSSSVGGWEVLLPYNPMTDSPVDPGLDFSNPDVVASVLANPGNFANPSFIPTGAEGAHFPVPLEMAVLLNSRPNPGGLWQPDWQPERSMPQRNTLNTNNVWSVEAGVNIELPFRDWTAEAYVSHAESSTYNVAIGNMSLSRLRGLLAQPDYGRGAVIAGNQDSIRPNFGAAEITCSSGFYDTLFMGDAPLSEDCQYAVRADLQTRTENVQDIIELNFQGSMMDLPAGELRAALGYQNRRNTARFRPDILQSTASFTDQVIGVYPTGYMDASMYVHDFYAEALVPVVSDLPFVQHLELELGARFSNYEHIRDETTWKALGNWEVNERLRFRGGFNRAIRAPNLGEMFLNPQEVLTGGGSFGDSCGLRSNAPFGAGGVLPDPQQQPNQEPTQIAPGQTEAGAMSTFLICQELMGGPDSPAVEQFYYTAAATGAGGGGFAWTYQQGNPNLRAETADTWTLGFVASSPFESPWLSGMNLSFDWYRIHIDDAIMLYSLDHAAYRCFGENIVSNRAEAQAAIQTPGCQLIARDQNSGAALDTTISYDNQAQIETAGFDVGLTWFGELPELLNLPGSLAMNLQMTYLDYYRTKQSPGAYDPWTEWKGTLGPNLSGTNGGAYNYRLFGTLTYMLNDWSVTLRWRHLPEVWTAGYASTRARMANNERVAAGGDGVILGYQPNNQIKTNAYNVFDMSFNWNVNEQITVRGGITNLFDTKPQFVGRSTGWAPGTDLTSLCDGMGPGCVNPTGWSLPGVGSYNGGFYDVIGRRFFMGVKARF